jgi:hypothetical protein
MDDHFCVAIRFELMPGSKKIGSKLEIVIDLAVEDNLNAAIFIAQRLSASGNIDDAEPSMSHRDSHGCTANIARRPEVMSVRIGAAMTNAVCHPLQSFCRDRL